MDAMFQLQYEEIQIAQEEHQDDPNPSGEESDMGDQPPCYQLKLELTIN